MRFDKLVALLLLQEEGVVIMCNQCRDRCSLSRGSPRSSVLLEQEVFTMSMTAVCGHLSPRSRGGWVKMIRILLIRLLHTTSYLQLIDNSTFMNTLCTTCRQSRVRRYTYLLVRSVSSPSTLQIAVLGSALQQATAIRHGFTECFYSRTVG